MKIFKYILIIVLLVLGVFFLINMSKQDIPENGNLNGGITEMSEQERVENYMGENISTLSPVDAVLGGTWYVVSMTVDTESNSGTVVYEDGHIQEERDFTYTLDGEGKVDALVIE